MATKLAVYNEALRLMGEERLSGLTEARAARYHLDDAYETAAKYCLEQGFWNHGMRAVEMDASGSITPAFGFAYAFERPTDWVRTYIISPTELLEIWAQPLNDEAAVWFANFDTLYAKYVSNDVTYGMNLGNWPESFAHYVACRLARMTCGVISSTSADKLDELKKDEKRARLDARSKDAMAEPPMRAPHDTWVRSRSNGLLRRPRSTSGGMIF
jgi:hypothetical protein